MKKVTKHSAFSKQKKTDSGKTEKSKIKNSTNKSKLNEDAGISKSFTQSPQVEGEQPFKPNHVQIEPLPPESNIN